MDYIFNIKYYIDNAIGGIARNNDGRYNTLLFKTEDSYCKQVIPNSIDRFVCTQILYNYENLIITEKTNFLKHGCIPIGKHEFYNGNGILERTVDMDEHFPITWSKLEDILKDKDVSLLTTESIFRYYDEAKDEATWSIVIRLPYKKGCLYVFDAKTGELIKEEIIDMSKEL